MTRHLPLLILAGFVAEVASIAWVGEHLGVVTTLLLLFLGGAAGVGLIRAAGANVVAALRSPVRPAVADRGVAGEALWRLISGLLLIIPGFFSDVVALGLLLPPIRRWIRSHIRVEPVEAQGFRASEGMVIEAEVVEISGAVTPPRRPAEGA